ncbi:MAG TPA: hypothetical protein VKE72_03285, partial [Methylocella sp.]|nr:hypothetical protein [Methylocella sp.]
AKALCDLGLLRPLDHANLQVCAKIRGKVTKIYALRAQVISFQGSNGGNGGNGNGKLGLSDPRATTISLSPSVIPLQPPDGQPPALSALLHDGTRLGLQRAIELLAASPDPGDRNYAAQLRGQTALINTLVSVQARIDEVQLKEKQREDRIGEMLRRVKEERAKQAERDKEDARRAREKGWCDDSLSDKTAAAIYREKSCPWWGKPDRSLTGN